jgi:hypothetical protein
MIEHRSDNVFAVFDEIGGLEGLTNARQAAHLDGGDAVSLDGWVRTRRLP